MRLFVLLILALFLSSGNTSAGEARLLRFPATNDEQIVFTFAGDLYTVGMNGGLARRMTSHAGYEMFARFSPNGQEIAFTGQYDGNTEVYLMPANGGEPKRLTITATLNRDDIADRMGPNNIVMDWKKDGSAVAFRSRMVSYNSFNGGLYLVDREGRLPEQLPVPRGGFLSFSPDGHRMVYNRVFREFRTWKRYRGGMADDLWIFDFNSKQVENITNNEAQDIIPMWIGEKIYFLSDRGPVRRMNLYVYDLLTKKTLQLTDYTEFDIKFPSAGKNHIVYELGGEIYKLNLQSLKPEKLTVEIAEDMAGSRNRMIKADQNITNFEIAPDGSRALFGARGDVFTVPAKNGLTYNLTQTPGIHERNSKWSPDGQWIAFISDETGEDEIWITKGDGSARPIQITSGGNTYKYQPFWSPDSKKLLWADRRQKLYYTDISTRKITEVAASPVWEFSEYGWSPDSKWITFTRPETEGLNRIMLYSLESGTETAVTASWYSSGQPVFSSDGKYLFFASARDFNPVYSWTEWNHAYQDMLRIYFVTLNAETPSPFSPENDQFKPADPGDSGKASKDKKKSEDKDVLKIDLAGIESRIISLPVKSSNYFSISAIGQKIYFLRKGSKDEKTNLVLFNLEDKKETDLGPADGYEISSDLKKMLLSINRKYYITDLPSAGITPENPLLTDNMEYLADYKTEWSQIFNESWRQMREFFYVENMHGVDWPAVREKYAALVPFVRHRSDLTYLIGEMIGELNAGHAYVGGGGRVMAEQMPLGLLGSEVEKTDGGFLRIKRILKGENWVTSRISPLTQVGVGAKEGDYILSINGQSTAKMFNPFQALINKAGKTVELVLNEKPEFTGSRKVLITPVSDEADLYYFNWVQTNIAKVEQATNGLVGYIHIPDMGAEGLNEFVKHFYPQLRKKALIVDVRGNGGGNVSPMIIERLRREAVMINVARNAAPVVNPDQMIFGPMVALADEFSASDGDIFAYRFKQHKLGKLIGKRTWGGVVGIRGSLPFIDGGSLNKPEFSRYDLEGKKWIMEGYGVDPDIFVDNDPYREFSGEDQQLNRAIEEILKDLKTQEKTVPPIPPAPEK